MRSLPEGYLPHKEARILSSQILREHGYYTLRSWSNIRDRLRADPCTQYTMGAHGVRYLYRAEDIRTYTLEYIKQLQNGVTTDKTILPVTINPFHSQEHYERWCTLMGESHSFQKEHTHNHPMTLTLLVLSADKKTYLLTREALAENKFSSMELRKKTHGLQEEILVDFALNLYNQTWATDLSPCSLRRFCSPETCQVIAAAYALYMTGEKIEKEGE